MPSDVLGLPAVAPRQGCGLEGTWRSLAIAALLGLAPLPLAEAQNPAVAQGAGAPTPPTLEEVEVTEVRLEVSVTDRGGEPVTGLQREDFVLLQEGRRVSLAGFSAPGGGASTGAAARPIHLVIVVQPTFLAPGELGGLEELLGDFLRALDPRVEVMLVEAGHGIDLLQGPTTDRGGVLSRLGRLEAGVAPSPLASEYAALLADIRRQARQGLDDRFLPTGGAQVQLLLTRIGAFAQRAYREIERAAVPLHGLLDLLAGLPGRRDVLLVGGRLPASAGQTLYNTWRSTFGRSSAFWAGIAANPAGGGEEAIGGDVELETASAGSEFLDTSPLLDALARHATGVGVTVHTVDVSSRSGSRLSSDSSGGIAGDAAAATAGMRGIIDSRALRSLAEAAGGRGLSRGQHLTASLADLGRELTDSYELTFEPPDGLDGQLHEIRVELPGRRRLELRHRRSYRPRSRDEETARRLVPALWLGVGGNPLGVELAPQVEATAAPRGAAGPQAVVHLTVRVPLANLALIPEGRSHRGRLSVFTASAPAGGSNAIAAGPVARSVVPVRLRNEEILASQGRKVEYIVEVPAPGPGGRIAVAVRDDFQGLTSVVTVSVGTDGLLAGRRIGEAAGGMGLAGAVGGAR